MDRGIDGRTEAAAEEEKRAIQEKSCVKIQTDALPERQHPGQGRADMLEANSSPHAQFGDHHAICRHA